MNIYALSSGRGPSGIAIIRLSGKDALKISKIILNKKKDLINRFNIKIEYLEAKNLSDLMTYKKNKKFKIFIAYYIRQIRLIDNF